MSWGTSLNVDIVVLREKFENIEQLDAKIEETTKNINHIHSKILMYCASTPKDVIVDPETIDIVQYIHEDINELLDWYNNELILLYKLQLIKDDFDNRQTY